MSPWFVKWSSLWTSVILIVKFKSELFEQVILWQSFKSKDCTDQSTDNGSICVSVTCFSDHMFDYSDVILLTQFLLLNIRQFFKCFDSISKSNLNPTLINSRIHFRLFQCLFNPLTNRIIRYVLNNKVLISLL